MALAEKPHKRGLPEGILILSSVITLLEKACDQVLGLVVSETATDLIIKPGQNIMYLLQTDTTIKSQTGTQTVEIVAGIFDIMDFSMPLEGRDHLREKLCEIWSILIA